MFIKIIDIIFYSYFFVSNYLYINFSLNKVVVTDSIEIHEDKMFDKLRILTTSKMFAETIKRIYWNEAISDLFEMPAEEREIKINE